MATLQDIYQPWYNQNSVSDPWSTSWTPDQVKLEGNSAWKYNPDSTWRVGASKYSVPDWSTYDMRNEAVGPNMLDMYRPSEQVQRLVDGQWTDYAVPHKEELGYLMSGIFDPDLYGDKALVDSPLHKFFLNTPSALGQLNTRQTYGYDANMFAPDQIQGFLSGIGDQLGTSGDLGDTYDPNKGAAWTNYMSADAQSGRAKARQADTVKEGLTAASMIASLVGGGNMLSNLFQGTGAGSAATASEMFGGLTESGLNEMFANSGLLEGAGSAAQVGDLGLFNDAGFGLENLGSTVSDVPRITVTGSNTGIPSIPTGIGDLGETIAGTLKDVGLPNLPGGGKGMTLSTLWDNITDPSKWTAGGLLDAVKLGSGLVGLFNNNAQGRDLEKTAASLAGDKMDRSFYRDELKKSYTDPWASADAQASRRNLRQIAERAGARGAVNPIHTELALQSKLAEVLDQRRRTLGTMAGAQFSPAEMAQLQLSGLERGGSRINAGIDNITAAIGNILEGRRDPTDFWQWLMSNAGKA